MQYTEIPEHGAASYPELASFFDEDYITSVLYVIKSGKEATVYCCEAHPSTGVELLAAKIYRSRNDRSFKNDAMYREGRWIPQKSLRRAVERKNRVGRETEFVSWVGQEFKTLKRLHSAGADVPKPYAQALQARSCAILMEYVGDRESAAPPLNRVRLEPDEARPLFELMMRNVELWLACDLIHADLSPFNVLYWEGTLKTIDFPQAVDPRFNRNALSLLERDIENLCRYWARHGVNSDPQRITRSMWAGRRDAGV